MMLALAFALMIVVSIVYAVVEVHLDRKRWREWQCHMMEFTLNPDKWVKDDVETDDTLPF